MDVYSYCAAELGTNASVDDKLECFSSRLTQVMTAASTPDTPADATAAGDVTVWFARDFLLLNAAVLVFLMQAGFAMVCAGCVRAKNVQNSMLKNLLDACGSSLAFYCIGYALAFGGDEVLTAMPGDGNEEEMTRTTQTAATFIGTSNFFCMGVDDLSFWIFQYTFSAASATIVAGTLAERCQMGAYLAYSLFLCGFVYPVVAHAIWSPHGFLSGFAAEPLWGVGVLDFAGSGVVHFLGGLTALLAAVQLGERRGRFHDPETGEKLEVPEEFPGHSIALQMLGTFILWFGWYGFNTGPALLSNNHLETAGNVASLAAVNTALSGGAGGISSMLAHLGYMLHTTGEPIFDLQKAMNGSLAGLAAITAGCGFFEPWAAILTGAIAGVLYLMGSHALVYLCIDDAVDAIPVHMCGGMWGMFSVGLFASPERLPLTYGHGRHPGVFYALARGSGGAAGTLMGTQLMGMLFVMGWCICIMTPFFYFLNLMGWFRSDPLEEIVGLDRSYHGGGRFLLHLQNENKLYGEPNSEELSAFDEMRRSKHSKIYNLNASSGSHVSSIAPENSDLLTIKEEKASEKEDEKEDNATTAAKAANDKVEENATDTTEEKDNVITEKESLTDTNGSSNSKNRPTIICHEV